jgi:hypothetical protein
VAAALTAYALPFRVLHLKTYTHLIVIHGIVAWLDAYGIGEHAYGSCCSWLEDNCQLASNCFANRHMHIMQSQVKLDWCQQHADISFIGCDTCCLGNLSHLLLILSCHNGMIGHQQLSCIAGMAYSCKAASC